ncbi:hypothetical protein U3A55_12040 [Salarchaeum sp. III]|uniref:hypothetical protein n=1 Tax=Salarchaeum sp. III TaxID=3107927 RepID=UPI002EDAAAF2
MPRYVHRKVAEIRENPERGEEIRLLVGVRGATQDVVERVRELNGEVVEELPFDSLVVVLSEPQVDSLCNTPSVESVELDEGMETLSGN